MTDNRTKVKFSCTYREGMWGIGGIAPRILKLH